MQAPSVVHSTFVLKRSYPKPPKTVFSAFSEESKKRRWYAEAESNEVLQFELDFRVGGVERLRYKLKPGTPVAGMIITNESRYQDIEPERWIVTTATMDLGEKRILVSLIAAEFVETANGTDLILTHHGAYLSGPNGLTPPMIEAGWSKILASLETEVAR